MKKKHIKALKEAMSLFFTTVKICMRLTELIKLILEILNQLKGTSVVPFFNKISLMKYQWFSLNFMFFNNINSRSTLICKDLQTVF